MLNDRLSTPACAVVRNYGCVGPDGPSSGFYGRAIPMSRRIASGPNRPLTCPDRWDETMGVNSLMPETMTVAGVDLEVVQTGAGRPLLFLHGGEGLGAERPWMAALARQFRVIAPVHPGFGRSMLPDWVGSVEDLAYLYLDLADQLDLEEAVLVGASFGGWVAAEMMVRSTARFSRLVLAAPFGIKVGTRDERDIADMHAMTREEFLAHAYADPAVGQFDPKSLTDIELASIARGREAFALYGWKPYMHNPRLKRWLHRIDRPTLLLWGDKDRIIRPGYRDGWTAEIKGARAELIAGAGHFPFWEQPEATVTKTIAFAR